MRTPTSKAAKALALMDLGVPMVKTVAETHLNHETIGDIVKGARGWDMLKLGSEFKARYAKETQKFIMITESLAQKAAERMEETIETASHSQAAISFGIALTKRKELVNEPIKIQHESIDRTAIISKLLDSLKDTKEEMIDITPSNNKDITKETIIPIIEPPPTPQ